MGLMLLVGALVACQGSASSTQSDTVLSVAQGDETPAAGEPGSSPTLAPTLAAPTASPTAIDLPRPETVAFTLTIVHTGGVYGLLLPSG